VGTVVVYPSKDKGPEIEALFTAGRVQLDGVVVKAIEAATEGDSDGIR
jgi:hypothetical protein